MTSKDEIISGDAEALRAQVAELRSATRRLRAAWMNAASENVLLENECDRLLEANGRLRARAQRAERRQRLHFIAPIMTGMMIGVLLVVIVGGAR